VILGRRACTTARGERLVLPVLLLVLFLQELEGGHAERRRSFVRLRLLLRLLCQLLLVVCCLPRLLRLLLCWQERLGTCAAPATTTRHPAIPCPHNDAHLPAVMAH
jgi:hypothetical protein